MSNIQTVLWHDVITLNILLFEYVAVSCVPIRILDVERYFIPGRSSFYCYRITVIWSTGVIWEFVDKQNLSERSIFG